jgi:hypothetical protein
LFGAERGRSSVVEHNLAKVGVEGSNPFARSNEMRWLCGKAGFFARPFAVLMQSFRQGFPSSGGGRKRRRPHTGDQFEKRFR